jgi:diguanylate cyclase (GGDEF)-like protein
MKKELLNKAQALSNRDDELSRVKRDLIDVEQRLTGKQEEYEEKCRALAAAEERADRYRQEYEDLDREMVKAQEQSAILSAKLQSVESRMERYQRLMDRQPNEFSRGDNPEIELEKLQDRIEELEVELAATTAATRSFTGEAKEETLSQLESECGRLKEQLRERERQVDQLETKLAGTLSGESGGGEVSAFHQRERNESKALLEELRFHRELEYQEAQQAVRTLQDRLAHLQVNGVDPQAADSPEVTELKTQLEGATEELRLLQKMADTVPGLNARVVELESELAEARSQARPSQDGGAVNVVAAVQRIEELEAELQRARQEASPEELQLARRRISELEATLADQPAPASGDGQLAQRNRQLENELSQTREHLQELNNELRRTLEGDRETKKLAYADQLTGLPNLNLTGQYLQVCYERSGRGEGALALILIDLDHFRRVNDALGQKAGDELLKEVGRRLQRTVTEKDTAIARRGEDEFMVVAFMENARVDGEALTARIRGIAHNLLNELARPFDILDQKVQVTASLGVALFPGPAGSRLELLEQSEHAMYKAKESGRARVSFYTEDMHNNRERRKYLEHELRQGLVQGQFGMVYQPIFDLTTNKIVGVEALLRWSHPTRGLLEPADFLEVAEDTGLIVQIGDGAIKEALGIAKQKFMKRRFLSLNLSFRQLIDSGFSKRFMNHLQVAGVPPHEVIVEVSEKATRVDPDRVKNTLAHLAHWGVGIALDDFGTGSSELAHLTELNLRVLKIDGSIISRIPDDQNACKLCHAITQMSQALGIPVLAEGVESREQLTQISSYGCKYAQGIILGAPVNVSQLVQLL